MISHDKKLYRLCAGVNGAQAGLHPAPAVRTHPAGELPVCFDVEIGDRIEIVGCCQIYHVSLSCSQIMRSVSPSAAVSVLQSRKRIHHSEGYEKWLRGEGGEDDDSPSRAAKWFQTPFLSEKQPVPFFLVSLVKRHG